MACWLLTGATGLLGQYLLRDLLLRGERVCVLTRETRNRTAEERIESHFPRWESEAGRRLLRPTVLAGELTQPDLGLSATDQHWVKRNVEAVLHSAASLSFTLEANGEPYRSNVEGTRNLLGLCRQLSVRRFCHVSTAYVFGQSSGRFWEDEFDVGQTPANEYERSKIQSEQLVREAEFLYPPTILRPSIIVGDSQTGFTSTFHGFYAPFQLACTLVKQGLDEISPDFLEQFHLTGKDRKNFVPVDWVSQAATRIILNPLARGRTFHLVHPVPTGMLTVWKAWAISLERWVAGARATNGKPPVKVARASAEQYLKTQLEVYRDYWRDDPIFDSSNTQAFTPGLRCPLLDVDLLVRLCKFAAAANFGMSTLGGPRDQAATAIPWNVGSRPFEGSPNDEETTTLILEVLGAQGGQWRLPLSSSLTFSHAVANPTPPVIRLSGETWKAIAAGRLSARQAIAGGRVWMHNSDRSGLDWPVLLERAIHLQSSTCAAPT